MVAMAVAKTRAETQRLGSSKLPTARRATLAAKIKLKESKRDCRRLIVVVNRKAKNEVKSGQHLKEVPVRTASRKKLMEFPVVRRNRKIQKVMHMAKACSGTSIAMQVLSAAAGSLSDAACIYDKRVVGVLQHPQSFSYRRAKDVDGVTAWNVMHHASESVVMQTDFSKDELVASHVDMENDIGVLTTSISQLLAKRSHDVIAVNTHPGHHAGPSRVAGFCLLNHIALAASLIKKAKPSWKLGVIDIDVHPGDGTQQFVELYPRMIDKYVSIHSSAQFRNMGADLGANGIALKLDNKRRCRFGSERHCIEIRQQKKGCCTSLG
eukprot:TRINITY_DN18768_c0_g1_i1.p1 TRINITY_DN18768_c0_g1~~TRINITY_DN18768_c0_g1_i1.p1  ORF type:complete len:323 (-),score=52.41 TRINITY_DN18768_c0_g1_i1:338-1306(-)